MKEQGACSGEGSIFPADLVLADGSLNGKWIARSEVLYRGMNGQAVERFYLPAQSQSYIFKPLTNDGQWGQEKWVYDNILPAFPPLYPRMLAESANVETGRHWIIFEDIGNLSHEFSEAAALQLVEKVAWWHALPVQRWTNAPLKGPKPLVEEMAAELLGNAAAMKELLAKLPLYETVNMRKLASLLDSLKKEELSSMPRVLSHGDLHQGNYAQADGRIVVLDWEHVHLNSPYWDLYHMIDMSHPTFPKTVTSSVRTGILRAYREHSGGIGQRSEAEFLRDYARFACIFSLWMLRLIAGDLLRQDEKWPLEQLQRQLEETVASLNECAEML